MVTAPSASILLIKVIEPRYFNLVLKVLNDQTVAIECELIVIVEDEASWREVDQHLVSNLGSVRPLIVGPIDNNDMAILAGILAANTGIVIYAEDHAYYTPDWIEGLIEAHQQGWTAVCTRMFNANPSTFWSWVNFISSFGPWAEGEHYGPVSNISRHNVSYLRQELLKYGEDELASLFPRGGRLHKQLQEDGASFYLSQKGSVTHINTSLMVNTILLRIKGGQLKAARHANRNGWSYAFRAILAAVTPVLPLIRFLRRYDSVFNNRRFEERHLKIVSAFMVGLHLEAIGNALGLLFGPANTEAFLAAHETGRFKELTQDDYDFLFGRDEPPLFRPSELEVRT